MTETTKTEGARLQKPDEEWLDEYIEYLEGQMNQITNDLGRFYDNVVGIMSLEDNDIISPVMSKEACRLDLISRAITGEPIYGI